jgi:hypothetical protein
VTGYRIEHRDGETTTVVRHGIALLPPLAAALAAEGKQGELVVVETATERVVIRSPLPARGAGGDGDVATG